MTQHHPEKSAPTPQAFRDALAELVQIGLSVARMVGRVAEAEAASPPGAVEAVSALATSLAEAIQADQAAAAAAEARQANAARTEAIARAFARVSRAVRLTILLAERLDRGWAQGRGGRGLADDRHAMARRQIARGVADAIARAAHGDRADRLTEALAERLERLDLELEIGARPAEDIIADICRDLGLDPARMTRHPAVPGAAPRAGDARAWQAQPPQAQPPQARPDG